MRFLVDAQLPAPLARLPVEHGRVAEHVNDIGPGDAPDQDLWRYALEHYAVIITKDEDFSDMALLADRAPTIVWIRVGNTRRAVLLAWFAPMIDDIVKRIEAARLAEVRNPIIELR